MKCLCKYKCNRNLDIEQDLENKDNVKLTIWVDNFFGFKTAVIVSKKKLKDALEKEGEQ